MPRTLTYAPRSRDDLEAMRLWLTQQGSGPLAWRRLDAILTTIEGLRDHPCLFPFGPHRGVRELPCPGGYRALYRVVPDTGSNETSGDIQLLRVFGPGQNRRAE